MKINQIEFEKQQKKNQINWTYILKVIASQSLVNSVFLNKTEKKKRKERWRHTGEDAQH